MSEPSRITVDGVDVGQVKVNLVSQVPVERCDGLRLHRFVESSFEATFTVDRAVYEGLQQGALYTVEQDIDHNPWHRKADGFPARARKLRDGLWWTFHKRVLRRELVETVRLTVPNCRLEGPA